MDEEKKGTLLALLAAVMVCTIPIFGKYATGSVNPIFLTALTATSGTMVFVGILTLNGETSKIISKKFALLLFLAGSVSALSGICMYVGLSMTSAINGAILLQFEVVYSLILSYFVLRERILKRQVLFSLAVFLGTIIVIYRGTTSINLGDILVLANPLFIQISHIIAKKLMGQGASTSVIVAGRAMYGAGIALSFAFLTKSVHAFDLELALLIFAAGVLFTAVTFVWYETIKRINLSKATSIVIIYPVISVILASALLHEVPTTHQILGLAIILFGIIGLSTVKSEKRKTAALGK